MILTQITLEAQLISLKPSFSHVGITAAACLHLEVLCGLSLAPACEP